MTNAPTREELDELFQEIAYGPGMRAGSVAGQTAAHQEIEVTYDEAQSTQCGEHTFRINGTLIGWTINYNIVNRIVIDLNSIYPELYKRATWPETFSYSAESIAHALAHSQWLKIVNYEPDRFRGLYIIFLKR